MSRIPARIQQRQAAGRKLLIPYLVAGDPDLDTSLRLMHGLVKAGADIIELGMPFSDPSSDGPVIQLASERALAAGTRLRDVLDLVSRFRVTDADTPVVLMGYLNPVEIMGYQAFADTAAAAGVDGVLLVDLPPREAAGLAPLLRERHIDTVFLVAPTTSDQRAAAIVAQCTGYLYYVSLKGVTGAAISDTRSIRTNVARLRAMTSLPLVIGFGIKDAAAAAAMADLADGVVIGSALVERIAGLSGKPAVNDSGIVATVSVIADSRRAMDAGKAG
ncbi:MAG: hypothetical protein RLZZ385_2338 [Pseudomonadota bacterium]|jgi:tryptophan synthase alpha chain